MSEIADEEVTLDEYVNAALEDRIAMIRVATPAVVAAYHASTQTVDVNLPVNRQVQDGNGGFTSEPQPSLKGIKVRFPRSRQFGVSFPPDGVMLTCCDRSIQQWRAHGASGDPGDLGMHTLDGAVAEPGLDDDDHPLKSADASDMMVGSDTDAKGRIRLKPSALQLGDGATEAVIKGTSFASAVGTLDAALTTLFTAIGTFATATGVAVPALSGAAVTLNSAIGVAATAVSNFTTAVNNAKSTSTTVL